MRLAKENYQTDIANLANKLKNDFVFKNIFGNLMIYCHLHMDHALQTPSVLMMKFGLTLEKFGEKLHC